MMFDINETTFSDEIKELIQYIDDHNFSIIDDLYSLEGTQIVNSKEFNELVNELAALADDMGTLVLNFFRNYVRVNTKQ